MNRMRLLLSLPLLIASGCATGGGNDLLSDRAEAPARAMSTESAATPVALVNGRPVTISHLNASLLEMAGGVALDEHILDLMLADEARRRGFAISAEDIARERQLFLDTLEDAGVADAEQDAEALLATVRRARGLGPARFDALLRRSALLRAFVRDEVVVNESMIALAHEIEHGEKRLIRVLATQTLAAAQSALDAIREGMSFGEAATRYSTDSSAARGGMIEPVSPVDPTYPESLRSAMMRLAPGQTSPPVLVDDGFVIVHLESVEPADGAALSETRETIARRVRRQQERLKMAELADRLRRRAQTSVLDPHLRFSSEAR